MNTSLYVKLTRIMLALAVGIAVLGSLAFVFLSDVTKNMPFSNF